MNVRQLLDAINQARLNVWRRQPKEFFHEALIDMDGTLTVISGECKDRCDQKKLIAQIAGGVRALSAPVDSLVSNWAYMVMTSLAGTLKAWSALLLPVTPRHREAHEAARRC